MNRKIKAAAALVAAGVLALSGCSSDAASSDNELNLVGYSVLEQANAGVIKAFEATTPGKDVTFKESYGASGDQARAVIAGQKADLVHLSLEPDVQKLVDEGLVADDWKNNATKGICTSSIVVMVVRTGNPKNITKWSDLTQPGIGIVTPNPASSGSAKWNLLAAYGSILGDGGTEADAQAYMKDFFGNIAALPDSGRDATTAFTSGTGDVLLSYENEAILARQSGTDFDYIIPDSTLKIENPCAVTTDAANATDANAFLDFQKSAEGQKLYAETGYRPLVDVGSVTVAGANDEANPFPEPAKLLTIDADFGGWADANTKYFDETDGILTKIQADSSQ
ncbi:sulfate ABC transporter substrate-binding protein [Nocardioides sp.]|jgi:sulfate transport system substrate-binding protein|uniref:sulfate ABC transporter substrate-binding protein n=1 Tax=Nocardioides sp. TaxID=35761 RepID=UPI0031FEF396|nr:sulfate transporter substrate-binding protein [Nocardioides sp.]